MAYASSPAAAIANKNSNRGARDIADRATPSLPNGCAGREGAAARRSTSHRCLWCSGADSDRL